MSWTVSIATVTVLPDGPAGRVEIVNRTGTRLELISSETIPAGTLIRIESGDSLWLAEVVGSFRQGTGSHLLAEVEHYLDRAKARFA